MISVLFVRAAHMSAVCDSVRFGVIHARAALDEQPHRLRALAPAPRPSGRVSPVASAAFTSARASSSRRITAALPLAGRDIDRRHAEQRSSPIHVAPAPISASTVARSSARTAQCRGRRAIGASAR